MNNWMKIKFKEPPMYVILLLTIKNIDKNTYYRAIGLVCLGINGRTICKFKFVTCIMDRTTSYICLKNDGWTCGHFHIMELPIFPNNNENNINEIITNRFQNLDLD